MTWQVSQDGLILNGDRIVGSMLPMDNRPQPRWRVEILWGGPGGDIVHENDNHAAALAFVIGVEEVFARLTATSISP